MLRGRSRRSSGRRHRCGPKAQPVVSKISWQQAGGIAEPGRYMFTFGWLTVMAEDLAIWNQFPDAVFTLVQRPSSTDEAGEFHAEEFHLGAFELPSTASPPPEG